MNSSHRADPDWDGHGSEWGDDLVSEPAGRAKKIMDGPSSTPALDALVAIMRSLPRDVIDSTFDAKINCDDCGEDHIRNGKRTCNAHSKRATPLRPCRLFPPVGLSVCRFHGGAAPQAVRAAQSRRVSTAVEYAVAEHLQENPRQPVQWLPEPRRKKGGHKKPNSWSARRARARREGLPWDDDGDRNSVVNDSQR